MILFFSPAVEENSSGKQSTLQWARARISFRYFFIFIFQTAAACVYIHIIYAYNILPRYIPTYLLHQCTTTSSCAVQGGSRACRYRDYYCSHTHQSYPSDVLRVYTGWLQTSLNSRFLGKFMCFWKYFIFIFNIISSCICWIGTHRRCATIRNEWIIYYTWYYYLRRVWCHVLVLYNNNGLLRDVFGRNKTIYVLSLFFVAFGGRIF